MLKYISIILFITSTTFTQASIIGTYDLSVDINGKLFMDTLTINKLIDQDIQGSFTLPNIFTAHFRGKYKNQMIQGSFIAKEKGNSLKVILETKVEDNGCKLTGKLATEESIFGLFEGIKRGCHESNN